jgi:hypothetical protein
MMQVPQVPQVPPCIGVVYSQRIRASLETSTALHTERVSRFRDHALQDDIFFAVLNVSYDSGFVDGLFQAGDV